MVVLPGSQRWRALSDLLAPNRLFFRGVFEHSATRSEGLASEETFFFILRPLGRPLVSLHQTGPAMAIRHVGLEASKVNFGSCLEVRRGCKAC